MVMDRTGPPDKSQALQVCKALGAATATTYDASITTPIDVKRRSSVGLAIDYRKGDETTMRFRVMVAKGETAPAHDSGEWYRCTELGDQSSGLREGFKGEVKLTPANFAASEQLAFKAGVAEWDWVRVDTIYVGGTGTGQIGVGIAGGWGM